MHQQPGGVGIGHETCRLAQAAVRLAWDHVAFVRPDTDRVLRDSAQPGWRGHLRIGQRITLHHLIMGLAFAVQLHQAQRTQLAQRFQVADFERLDVNRRRGVAVAAACERLDQRFFHGQAQVLEVLRMLGLDVQANLATLADLQGFHQVDDFLQGGNLELAVEAGVARTDIGDALDGAQTLEFGGGEVLAEPAVELDTVDPLLALAISEFRVPGHVGGQAEFVVVACKQLPVLAHHQVRFNIVGALQHGDRVGREGMLRQVTAGATVGDDQRFTGIGALGGGHC